MQTKVSMVVPCYNKVKFIGEMFDSVLAQKWDNIELILVNDGSTDGTRKIITEYEPKFCARGYGVVIIDQENQGVAAAIKHGLMRVTGEYVCMPDCDDYLHPEYVSAMADALNMFPEASVAVCDESRNLWNKGYAPIKANEHMMEVVSPERDLLAEFVLFDKIYVSAWILMFRSVLIDKTNLLVDFVVEGCLTQEPQIWIPLLAKAEPIVHVKRALYKMIPRDDSIVTSQKTLEKIYQHADARVRTTALTLKKVGLPPERLDYYYKINSLAKYEFVNRRLRHIGASEDLITDNTLSFVTDANGSGLLPNKLETDKARQVGFEVMYRAVNNYLVGYKREKIDALELIRNINGRIIAYGAGLIAKKILPDFLRCDIIPSVIWDTKACNNSDLFGIPMVPPDFNTLSKNDTVIILLNNSVEVEIKISESGAKAVYYQDLLDSLAAEYFGDIWSWERCTI